MIDLDPTTIDQHKTGPSRDSYMGSQYYSGKEGAGNNFARAYQVDSETVEAAVESIRS